MRLILRLQLRLRLLLPARLELLREETTDEPADIAASEESLEPNMNKGPKLSECTSFVQKNVHRGLRFFRCGNW